MTYNRVSVTYLNKIPISFINLCMFPDIFQFKAIFDHFYLFIVHCFQKSVFHFKLFKDHLNF